MAQGIISDLQHFSTGDGPGIRTTVFFKGCNLRCRWCHNPETFHSSPELMYYGNLCKKCGSCVSVCPTGAHSLSQESHSADRNLVHSVNRTACIHCGKCAVSCPSRALVLCGRLMTVSEVMDYILEDKDFYISSGGGVTLSGGEPLLQAEFCAAVAAACQSEGIPVILDTAGCVDYKHFRQVLPCIERVYLDLKAASAADMREYTGGNLPLVLDNLGRLLADGIAVTIRIPVIPGYSDSPGYAAKLAQLLVNLISKSGSTQTDVELLPFHRLGSGKYTALGLTYPYADTQPPEKEHMEELREVFAAAGLCASVQL